MLASTRMDVWVVTNLARLSSTQEQHLDLVLGHHAVPLDLVLNLIVAWGGGGEEEERKENRGWAAGGL